MSPDDDVPLFRAPMRSRDDRVPDGGGVERGLRLGLCGMGGRLEGPSPSSLAEAVDAAAAQHDSRLARRIERFADVPDGVYVWTRDVDGHYWLGRLAGPWRYDASDEAHSVDLVHVRECTWRSEPTDRSSVPDAVLATFARGGRNWQRIRSEAGAAESAELWAR
ncbi:MULTISPECIES: GAF domain-containing protein [unclassified Dietzia]|uniref:GAF domain-containing protein n=1 Tax=unclassified Dietzia TaxID=2617939 RepID=UPI000D21FAF6|nr:MULTISPECIES: GAF domain-containing protein [unclassified Dietzia]AVZ38905.1 GAF domain-containing protein [Dietzia sp. JS16-p6b]QGW24041.1 hypothetical protein GJR88_01564 [Dietzia sp. DQ12-45-1b]